MGGAPFIIILVGLVIPITLIFGALMFDAAVVVWATYRVWHDRAWPSFSRFVNHALATGSGATRQYVHRLRHH